MRSDAVPDPSPSEGSAIYRYRDDAGTVHFSTGLDSVPARYREKAAKFVANPGKATDGPRATVTDLKKNGIDQARKLSDVGLKTARKLSKGALAESKKLQKTVGGHVPIVNELDPASVLFGFGSALGLVLVFKVFRSRFKLITRFGVVAGILALIAGGYFGALRSAAGLGGARVSSPQQIVEDAKKARDQANKHFRRQERLLNKIGKESR